MRPNNKEAKINLNPYDNLDLKELNDFIDNNLIDTLDYDDALEEVLKLADFILENKAALNHHLIYEIVIDNRLLNSLLSTIVSFLTDYNNLDFDNEILISLIRAYLMQNNLIEKDEEEFNDFVDFDYYKKENIFIGRHYKINEKSKLIEEALANNDQEKLIKVSFPGVLDQAKFLLKGRIPFYDMIGEVYIILKEAVLTYDIKKGVPFTRYVQIYVNNHLRKYIYKNGNQNHYGYNVEPKLANLKRVIYYYESRNIPYDVYKLAKRLNLSPNYIRRLLSIDENLEDYDALEEDALNYLEEEPFEEVFMSPNFNAIDLVNNSLLTNNEKEFIIKYYNLDNKGSLNLIELAKIYNTSKQNIKQIKDKGLFKLLNSIKIIRLIDYADKPDEVLKKMQGISLSSLIISCLLEDYQNIFELASLTEIERNILTMHYGLDGSEVKSIGEIATMYNKHAVEITKIEAIAFYKIACSGYLKPYLDILNFDDEINLFKSGQKRKQR